jgi:hypothetical protein
LSHQSLLQSSEIGVIPNLHRDQPVVYQHFLRQEIGSYRSFVTCAELFIDLLDTEDPSVSVCIPMRDRGGERAYILIHQRGLADAAVAEYDDLGSKQSAKCFGQCARNLRTFSRTFFLEAMIC